MERAITENVLPAMSYTSAEVKPRAREGARPTEAQVRERAHLIWLERKGEAGNPVLDWLQAEMELEAELRTGRATPGRTGRAASMVEARPEVPAAFARADAPIRRARAA